MQELLFATHNAHKASEIARMLSGSYKLLTLDEAGITTEIPEIADSIEGNALIKAQFLFGITGKACFADDTGLEVEALNGDPGIRTARYAGSECDPDKNMDKLLAALEGKECRKARFRTIVAYVDKWGEEYLFEGICQGSIATARHGEGGFGYDPIFEPDGYNQRSFAEMTADEKNRISHRGQAVAKFIDFLTRNR